MHFFVDFFVVCFVFCSKSLIKLTKTRIDVIRRKRNATQKFLRKDVVDLLANGLDINAYGRVKFTPLLFVLFCFAFDSLLLPILFGGNLIFYLLFGFRENLTERNVSESLLVKK